MSRLLSELGRLLQARMAFAQEEWQRLASATEAGFATGMRAALHTDFVRTLHSASAAAGRAAARCPAAMPVVLHIAGWPTCHAVA